MTVAHGTVRRQRIHTPQPQGSPKACSSWRALSTRPDITGFAKGVFLSPIPHSTTFQSLVLLYKCIFCNGPPYIKDLFELRQSVYNLRGNGSILSQPKFNLSWKKQSSSYKLVMLWNKLPSSVRLSLSLKDFKPKLRSITF